ncbi:hypothetical protein SAMN04487886_102128 [Clostridium sp. DSM 8431]|uniref:hypothetical protein n=1 Tax=Clostridium sp. DSM 8431 TaxID=1761781 RepID=UPI0008E02DF1|nr:hypothetical protein [Clostridium sp. DSM 8431]SFU41194.1 hypothetical protein SAMN04487886_102128 [Clostridium sp. DSM 8431]
MSKVIYLYNQDNLSSNEKIFKIILNFFQSVSSCLIIQLFNFFFNESLDINSSVNIYTQKLDKDKNNYVKFNSSLSSINFTLDEKYLFSIEFLNKPNRNFSLYLLKYDLTNALEDSYIINLPDVKILELENEYSSLDNYNYITKIYTHSLSYKIPVFKLYNYSLDYIKDNKLYILLPLSILRIYTKVFNTSKIGLVSSNFKKEILNLNKSIIKDLNSFYIEKYLTKEDKSIFKDTINLISDCYLDFLLL